MPKISEFQKFIARLVQWEYWSFSVLYLPVFPFYGWLAFRCRSFFFFTASNPSVEFAGMFGEKKSEIYDIIPKKYIPKMQLIQKGNLNKALEATEAIEYPLIAKPNVGERGIWVKKINDQRELEVYVQTCPVNFLLQELINLPVELGVFFIKYPGQAGRVTSIVRKDFLMVTGDGCASVNELLLANERAVLTAGLKSDTLREIKNYRPRRGESMLIEPIGNHCRGTKFLNDSDKIDDELHKVFNTLASEIPDFYFGRFDIRCKSMGDLKKLKNFKIIELNGAGSEPSHIYQPGYSLWKAYRDIFWHLNVLAEISRLNHKNGVPYWSFKRGYKMWRRHQKYNRLLSTK